MIHLSIRAGGVGLVMVRTFVPHMYSHALAGTSAVANVNSRRYMYMHPHTKKTRTQAYANVFVRMG